MAPGWYPEKAFDWHVTTNPDGSTALTIVVYPFIYDPETTDVLFYTTYTFDVRVIPTTATISQLSTGGLSFTPGDTVPVMAVIHVDGGPRDLYVRTSILNAGTLEQKGGLDTRALRSATGDIAVDLSWATSGMAPGKYVVDLAVVDAASNVLDRASVDIVLGQAAVTVERLTAEPARFAKGQPVHTRVEIRNRGASATAGTCVVQIILRGATVVEFRHDITSLAAGTGMTWSDTWDTGSAESGPLYTVLGYVQYDGRASLPMSTVVSTDAFPTAAFVTRPAQAGTNTDVTFDGSSSTDADGTITGWHWDLGNAVAAAGKEFTTRYARPGTYAVTLTVTDNNGGTGSVTRSVVVTQATPPPPPVQKTVIVLTIDSTRFTVNGEARTLDAAPVIREGRTLLPIRPVAEAIGALVEWDGVERKASITLGTTSLELWIGNPTARVNGQAVPIDPANTKVTPLIVPPGRTMLPLRFVGESLGCLIEWNASTRQVTVTYPTP
jgi:chitodextrinase